MKTNDADERRRKREELLLAAQDIMQATMEEANTFSHKLNS